MFTACRRLSSLIKKNNTTNVKAVPSVSAKLMDCNLSVLDRIDVVSRDHNLGVLFPTKVTLDIFRELDQITTALRNGAFIGRVGSHSRLIIGEKGTGKSETLKRAVVAASHLPGVIGIYNEYQMVQVKPPSDLIVRALRERGYAVPDFQSTKTTSVLGDVLDFLDTNNLFVLFVADEVDQIYRNRETDNNALYALGELSALGSSALGRVSPIICSSAEVLPDLIFGKGSKTPIILESYPLSRYGPNMNDTKYNTMRHTPGPIMDDTTFMNIIKHFFANSPARQMSDFGTEAQVMSLVYFCCGSNILRIKRFAMSNVIQVPPFLHGLVRTSHTYLRLEKVICAVNNRLWQMNFHLFREFDECVAFNSNTAMGDKWMSIIVSKNWQTMISGISGEELYQICKATDATLPEVIHLVDMSWFSWQNQQLFPTSPFALFCASQFSDTASGRWKIEFGYATSAVDLIESVLKLKAVATTPICDF